MYNKKTVIVFALLLSSSCFASPLLDGLLGGGGKGGNSGEKQSDGKKSGAVTSSPGGSGSSGSSDGGELDLAGLLFEGKLLGVLDILPLNAGLDGLVGDLVTLIRALLEKVIQILQKLLPSLDTEQLETLTALLENENMTKSEILQTLDKFIAGQPLDLQELYKSIVEDVQGKVDATLDTLIKIANGISPELGDLVSQIAVSCFLHKINFLTF